MTITELAAELAETTLVDEEHIGVWTDDDGSTVAVWDASSGEHLPDCGYAVAGPVVHWVCEERGVSQSSAEVVSVAEVVASMAAWPRRRTEQGSVGKSRGPVAPASVVSA